MQRVRKSDFRFLIIATVLTPFLLEIIRNFVRPVYGRKEFGIISEILGWLPNFLAGFGFVLLGQSAIFLVLQVTKLKIAKSYLIILIILIAALSFGGLFLHEIGQKGSGLFYDVKDIYATLGGVIGGIFVFLLLLARNPAISKIDRPK